VADLLLEDKLKCAESIDVSCSKQLRAPVLLLLLLLLLFSLTHRALMDGTTQPHSLSRRPQPPSKPKAAPNAGNSSTLFHLLGSNRPASVLDAVLGAGVVGWDPVLGDDPSGPGSAAAAAAAAVGGLKLDADHMQQYGISQVRLLLLRLLLGLWQSA
jgi:hypothetical protein